jgi:hypothetical protein
MNSLAKRADIRARFDLRRNYLSLYLAIAGKKVLSPKQALHRVYGMIEDPDRNTDGPGRHKAWTDERLDRIEVLRSQGKTWVQVGDALDTTAGGAFDAYKKYRKGEKTR